MKTSAAGRNFIESFEGLILQAYDDANDRIVPPGGKAIGTLTIGYGHTTAAGPPAVVIGQQITKDTADSILALDLAAVEAEVARYIKVPLSQQQLDAIVSFQFNTGWLAHPNCSLARALNAGNYNLAANDFGLYDEASGRVMAGLARRRAAERNMFLNGVYTSTAGTPAT